MVTTKMVKAKTRARDFSDGPLESRRDLEIMEVKGPRSGASEGFSSKTIAWHFRPAENSPKRIKNLPKCQAR